MTMTSVQVVSGWGRERGWVSHLEQSNQVQSFNHTEPFALCKMGTRRPQLVVQREGGQMRKCRGRCGQS